ncbi:unnamed protein product, partial [Taenia asiatica]|uniref:B box-type domain-containing protein n=1 Tax=Taenia asiatica TaxID=60517 RepID=A0A0R3VZW9_TAEAS
MFVLSIVPRRLRDPYSLPCGHTFCLRPCLLPHAKAETSRCIHCDATFDASQLSPNYATGARLYLLSSQLRQEQEEGQGQKSEQQVEDNDECAEELSNDGKEISEKPRTHIDCSTCRRAVEANVLDVCHHCHQNICPQCREKHHERYRSTVRVKLNALYLRKAILKSRSVQLRESKHSLSEVKKAKDELLCALEGAVMELRSSASKSLDSATAKLEMMEMADYEKLNPLLCQITNLIAEV